MADKDFVVRKGINILPSGGTLTFNDDVVITHSTDLLSVTGGNFFVDGGLYCLIMSSLI